MGWSSREEVEVMLVDVHKLLLVFTLTYHSTFSTAKLLLMQVGLMWRVEAKMKNQFSYCGPLQLFMPDFL